MNTETFLNQEQEKRELARKVSAGGRLTPAELATFVDHTLLKPETTPAQIDALCDQAIEHGFWSVCINSAWVSRAAARLKEEVVRVCCVVGFPLGAVASDAKAFETRKAIEDGAEEIDMVINVGALKAGDLSFLESDIAMVLDSCGTGALLKVIIETSLLTETEKVQACKSAQKIGAHFVKTSTGFSQHGATPQDVALMRQTVGETMGVKAAGGIRSFDDAMEMIRSGATRIGTSSGPKIVSGEVSTEGY
ncbi:MAG: deoxyribose-phosphate aldolase [Spirochaetaceae bacterium]